MNQHYKVGKGCNDLNDNKTISKNVDTGTSYNQILKRKNIKKVQTTIPIRPEYFTPSLTR